MYLKRIELHGFKSFADKVNVEFQPGITGIVGPNGCGKSNISDAVRWVLGEQSVKSLRGSNMSDVIFAGSEDRRAQNLAEVTLVFDNSDRTLNYDYNEVEITRRLYRQGNEAEYLLNRQQCRLKDITDLILDTGLGRDSLSIISQGNISNFADNRPEERRAIFEEAAGVSKYKKRKIEAIRKLERTKENLDRIGDIVYELEKQITPLKKQKEKAETYLELKEKLTSIEVNVLVHEISETNASLEELSKILKSLNEKQAALDAEILLKESANDEIKKKMFVLDNEINALQSQLLEAMSEVSRLETSKVEVDQKRKHALESKDNKDIAHKLENLKAILADVVEEYNNRVGRLEETEKDLNDLFNKQKEMTLMIQEKHQSISHLTQEITKNKNRQEILIDLVENKSNYHSGVKAVMSLSNQNPDIIGVFGDLIKNDQEYDLAISTALGSALQFIVTKDDLQARLAIKFLRDNKAGRATFLPLETMEPRSLREEHEILCPTLDGYLGVVSDFVSSDKKIENVILNQLGNVILADNIDHASEISKATYARYKVVTLDGNIVNVGGSLTGGSANKQQSSIIQKRELEKVKEHLKELENKLAKEKNELNSLENESKEISHTLLQKQMSYAKLEVVVQNKKEELIVAKGEYEDLSHQNVELEDFKSGKINNQLVIELNEAIQHRDQLTEQIKSKREMRMSYVNENEQLESALKTLRKDLKDIQSQVNEKAIASTKQEAALNNYLNRLSNEYAMTYEYASENYQEELDMESARYEVAVLRNEINALGHVNLDAIEEYEEVSKRYEDMNGQRLDLIQAQDKIIQAIDEMDDIMVEKFSTTFDKINYQFNLVFRELFGGGRAEIKYTDPNNILETGIDIDVQPPGKSVSNITLFSGGEKALIAISCLFAILKVRPVPMCILDEVEAALDMANVERFAKFLREFSSQTQFIVVTHREGTMEECDLLYGATMQQKGVTKLVSVKLEEAVDFSNDQHQGGV
ncbi:chromosome segregation protein SMC [Coprobacillus sp. AF21-8LB]|nr:chromosome segregation protein SMC [Coprobacillus sp. AF21-8LB]